MVSIGEIFAYFKQISRLDSKDIEVAKTNMARKAIGFNANVAVLDNVSPMLFEIK